MNDVMVVKDMRNPEHSSVNPNTGDVTYNGPLSLEKGDHSHMLSRTDAYLPGDERGHVNASSLDCYADNTSNWDLILITIES